MVVYFKIKFVEIKIIFIFLSLFKIIFTRKIVYNMYNTLYIRKSYFKNLQEIYLFCYHNKCLSLFKIFI